MALIGYARCSTQEQNLEIQIDRLKEAGCEIIYSEKVGGAKAINKRVELEHMLKALRHNDVVVAVKLDRIARDVSNLLKISEEIKAKQCHLKLLDQTIDTTTPTGELVFHILGALAQFERSLISQRTADAIQHARKQGKQIGRPSGTTKEIDRKIKVRWKNGESWNQIAEDYNISRQAVYRRIKKWREQEATEQFEQEAFSDTPKE